MSDKCFKNTTINTAYYLTVSIPVYFNITFYWCENLVIWQKRTENFQCAFDLKKFDSEIKLPGRALKIYLEILGLANVLVGLLLP
jgi:hypothetical protein